MRVLLDTNIIIHRENSVISNYNIGHLFNWLDKLKCTKIVHPYSIQEINKHYDKSLKELLAVKLQSYEILKTVKEPDEAFLDKVNEYGNSPNDEVDNHLLYEVYKKRVDVLVTEDRKMLRKATILGISRKVVSIDRFISVVTAQHPDLIDYKMLAVKREFFGNIPLEDSFFDSFRQDYNEFDDWFNRKCDESAYVCSDEDLLLGFLYLKVEDENENYNDITPTFKSARRLKIGTFKVESTGFRLGERFIKIIFDNALLHGVDEIYVTLFKSRNELRALSDLLMKWGFTEHGVKKSANGQEVVLVKGMKYYDNQESAKKNFPNLKYNQQKFILPILDKYHTTLLPDSKLNTEDENEFDDLIAHRYALQKVYISWCQERNIYKGDIILFYRMGAYGTNKKYSSVLSTVGIVDEIVYNLNDKAEYLNHCKNRSVFSNKDLDTFWEGHRENLMIVKFIFVKSLKKRLTLEYLWTKDIVEAPRGPRPFTRITDEQFDNIMRDSQTEIQYSDR